MKRAPLKKKERLSGPPVLWIDAYTESRLDCDSRINSAMYCSLETRYDFLGRAILLIPGFVFCPAPAPVTSKERGLPAVLLPDRANQEEE